jgi:para-nitrobenzyl esterase
MMSTEDVIAETANGRLRGDRIGDVCVFKGIAYGGTTGGKNRFRPPLKPEAWAGVRDARRFGNGCWQNFAPPAPGTLTHDVYASFFDADETWKLQGEDCLVLNVWTPTTGDSRKRPVMVWFHGGSFTQGCGSTELYDGTRLARRGDTIIVTVNHRLNVFGYLHLADLDARFAQSGNAGMLDLVAALEWVRDNIASFGGDSGNVTIFGESGGGAKVATLMAMPAAKGLFHRAIVQSGASVRANGRDEATRLARLLLAELDLGENRLDVLQDIDPHTLLRASAAAEAKAGKSPFDGSFGSWAPLVDGISLPRHPFDPTAPAESFNVPLMIGTTKDETSLAIASLPGYAAMSEEYVRAILASVLGARAESAVELYKQRYPGEAPGRLLAGILTDFLGTRPADMIAERKSRDGGAPVFLSVLAWETPVVGGLLRSVHALDVPLMFDNVEFARSLVGEGPEPLGLADIMSSTWLAFARTGSPDNPGIPQWSAYDAIRRATMIFDREPRLVEDYSAAVRSIWADTD